jgi:hypothetical protein
MTSRLRELVHSLGGTPLVLIHTAAPEEKCSGALLASSLTRNIIPLTVSRITSRQELLNYGPRERRSARLTTRQLVSDMGDIPRIVDRHCGYYCLTGLLVDMCLRLPAIIRDMMVDIIPMLCCPFVDILDKVARTPIVSNVGESCRFETGMSMLSYQ